MKANQKFINGGDDAVSPVIAVILMVAITVVLAATVYLFVSGFGSNQQQLVQATFAAKAVALPSNTCNPACPSGANLLSSATDNAIQLTYSSGSSDIVSSSLSVIVDGQKMTVANPVTSNALTVTNPAGAVVSAYCTNLPSGASSGGSTFTWSRGATLYLWGAPSNANTAAGCGTQNSMKAIHLIQVSVNNQVVLDTKIEVHS